MELEMELEMKCLCLSFWYNFRLAANGLYLILFVTFTWPWMLFVLQPQFSILWQSVLIGKIIFFIFFFFKYRFQKLCYCRTISILHKKFQISCYQTSDGIFPGSNFGKSQGYFWIHIDHLGCCSSCWTSYYVWTKW